MKVGILIPTRGDRKAFLDHALKMIGEQTVMPSSICIVDDTPLSNDKDITWRYQKGYERLKNKCDVVACWEDDDCYLPQYIEKNIDAYKKHGAPDLFGCNYTFYFHIRVMKYAKLTHPGRASMMNTFIKSGLNIDFGVDKVFTDVHIWKSMKGVAVEMPLLSMGIKHGIGMSGGIGHRYNWNRYVNDDPQGEFLRSVIGDTNHKFYTSLVR